MKRFDLIVKTNIWVACMLLLIRVVLCVLEKVTLRNSIGVLIYGYFTDLFVLTVLSLPVLVFITFRNRILLAKFFSLIFFIIFMLAIDFHIITAVVNIFTRRVLKMNITFLYFFYSPDIIKIIKTSSSSCPICIKILYLAVMMVLTNIVLFKFFKKRFWRTIPL